MSEAKPHKISHVAGFARAGWLHNPAEYDVAFRAGTRCVVPHPRRPFRLSHEQCLHQLPPSAQTINPPAMNHLAGRIIKFQYQNLWLDRWAFCRPLVPKGTILLLVSCPMSARPNHGIPDL